MLVDSPRTEPASERAARIVTAYRIVSRAYFHLPIVVVFLLLEGLSVLVVGLCMALYGVIVAVGGPIVKPLRERLSLAGSLFLGELVKVCGLAMLLFDIDPWIVVISQVLSGLGFVMTAGTDAALASTLREGERYHKQETNTQAGMFLISFAAGVLGALSFTVWDRLPFVLAMSAGVAGAALAVATRLPMRAPVTKAATETEPGGAGGRVPATVRFWAAYYSMNRALLLSAYTFLIPLQLVISIEVPFQWFGLVLGMYTLFGLVAAKLSPRAVGLGATPVFGLTAVAMVIGLGVLLFDSMWVATIALGILGIAGGFIRPATMISLEPAMASLSPRMRQGVMRGLERRQGLIQAALLIVAGLWVWRSESISGALVAYVATAAVFQAAGAVWFGLSSRKRTEVN